MIPGIAKRGCALEVSRMEAKISICAPVRKLFGKANAIRNRLAVPNRSVVQIRPKREAAPDFGAAASSVFFIER
jgi:hypothetical protein